MACGGLAEPLVITLNPGPLSLGIGETDTLTAEILDARQAPVTNEEVLWFSSFPEVATVAAGVVVAVASGTTDVSASIGQFIGFARITVFARATGTWTGILGNDSSSVVTLEIMEDMAGTIEGTASIAIGGIVLDYGIIGRHNHPSFQMTWSAPGNADLTYQGSFNGDDMMNGRITSPGLLNNTANLSRQ